MRSPSKAFLFQFVLLTGIMLNLGSAYALKRQENREIQTELTQWLRETENSPSLSSAEKDLAREFIFKIRLKTHNKDSIESHKSLMQDFKKSSDQWEKKLGELLETELERGESLISFLKAYVFLVPHTAELAEDVQDFKDSRLYFDGKKMKEANPQNFEEAGQSAEIFLKQKEDLTLPEWYRLDLSAPLKHLGPHQTTPEASKTL
jgi:hypothetical protein